MVKIYGLVCPVIGQIRYIGKTEQRLTQRLCGHLSTSHRDFNNHKNNWLNELKSIGERPRIWLLEEVADGVDWRDREKEWIAKALSLGFRLTNRSLGGEGTSFVSESHRDRFRASMRTLQARPDVKIKQSLTKKRAWSDPDCRQRMMNRWTPEAKAKQVIALEERRNKIMAAMTPEVRAKQGAKLKETWARRKAAKA